MNRKLNKIGSLIKTIVELISKISIIATITIAIMSILVFWAILSTETITPETRMYAYIILPFIGRLFAFGFLGFTYLWVDKTIISKLRRGTRK